MKKHLKYASYIIRHKYFVWYAGQKTGAPQWRLLIHDWSKLFPNEWVPYCNFFNTRRTPATKARFDEAWLRHIHKNPHHWNHWVLIKDNGKHKALPMPDPLIREMVADWMGAGRAITGKWEVKEWYQKNKDHINLHPSTRARVESLIGTI